MASLNKVFLMGNLTRDPELRYLQSGSAKLNAGIAVNRKYRNRNQELVEETTFVDIEGWGPQAENFNKYLTKGRPVFIEGRLRLDQWESKDGQKRSKLLVVMDNFQFIGGRGDAPPRDNARDQGAPRDGGVKAGRVADRGDRGQGGQQSDNYDFDDIPF